MSNLFAKEQIKKINAKLEEARDAYYKKAAPIMTDAEYDELEKHLQGLVKEYPNLVEYAPVLKTVGDDADSDERIKHLVPMLSIENQYTFDDVLAWCKTLPENTKIVLEPKFDGASVSIVYEQGKFVRAASRSGEDYTAQVGAIKSIPKELNAKDSPLSSLDYLEIRGELVMKNSTLEAINAQGGKQYSSTRNLTAGTMKQRDLSIVASRDIMLMPWDVLGDDIYLPDSSIMRLKMIAEVGFNPPFGEIALADDMPRVIRILEEKLADRETVMRQSLSLETDGVVIKVNSQELRRKLGVASKYTNWQICYKPQSASGTTYLREIVWQVGRTGRVSPVAKCDVVVLAGANITSASLNNITYIRKMGLKLNAKVEMLRSGDVIPQIVRVIDEGDEEIVPPNNCPHCAISLIEKDEGGEGVVQSYCTNTHCPAILRENFAFIGNRDVLEIDGLGPEMARKLVDGDYARNLWELYEFQKEAMANLELMGEKPFIQKMRNTGFDATMPKMLRSLEKAKTAPWERWIKALGIPMVGETLGKVLATAADLKPEDMEHLPLILSRFLANGVEGFGEAKTKSVQDWAADPNSAVLCNKLYEFGIRPTSVEKPKLVSEALKGVVFCITGDVTESRDSLYQKLEKLGAVGKTGVSSKVNLLIVLPGAGKTKITKATSLGIKQVDEVWLAKTLADNGLPMKANTFVAEQA